MPASSKQQQKFMGMVHALKKGDIKPSDVSQSVKDAAKSMSKKDAKDFASTPHKGLPKKVKQEILKKLKEYANKMAGNKHGGSGSYGYAPQKGLRDDDGYDNVDYNRDMPRDESVNEEIDGLKNAQSRLKKVYRHLGVEYGQTRRGDKYVQVNYIPKSSPQSQQPEFVKVFYDDDKELQKIGKKLKLKLKESVNEASRGEIFKAAKRGSYPATVVVSQVRDMKSKVIKQVTVKTPAEAPATIKVLQKKYPKGDYKISLEDRTGKIIFKESMNEGPIDRVVGGRPYKYVGDGRKGKVTVSGPLKDRERKDILKRAKKAGYSAAPGIKGGVVIHVESIYEGMFSTLDQIRQDSKNVRDFVKNVFADRDFKKMKNDKEFIKYLKSIYEGVDESKGVPQNYMQGRVSDYHTALRGKNRDYSGGTNFKKSDSGQPDIEDNDEDQETNSLSEDMGNLSSSERIELYKLYSKAMRAMPGSPNQKKIKVLINKIRKKANLKPLPISEYGQRLDLSYLEDMEMKLKGTPEPKDAIDRDIEEYSGGSYEYTKGDQYGQNSVNEIGVFPVQNYFKGILPSKSLDISNDRDRERVKSLIKDLVFTLNDFWKSHKIPFRVREPRKSDLRQFKQKNKRY